MVSKALYVLPHIRLSFTLPSGIHSIPYCVPDSLVFFSVPQTGQLHSVSGMMFCLKFFSSPCEWLAPCHPQSLRLNVTSLLCPFLTTYLESSPHSIILSHHLYIPFLACLQFVNFPFGYLLTWFYFVILCFPLCTTMNIKSQGQRSHHSCSSRSVFGMVIGSTQCIDSNVNLIQEQPHRHIKSNVWPNVWAPRGPVKLIHKINDHTTLLIKTLKD